MQPPIETGPRTTHDFFSARRQAKFELLLSRLTGRPTQLLSYEDVRAKLHAIESSGQVLREIPLDAIVGSVGRYADFTRSFLPKQDTDRHRWGQVKALAEGFTGFPPIEVYQIGEAYFVRDGNHRVSVTRRSGATHIQAYVTNVRSDVPLEADVQPDDLIIKAEYADFLESTGLRTLLPEAEISLTAPGKYRQVLEHIEVHRYFMGIEGPEEIPYADAVMDWYARIYLPMVKAIRQSGVLLDFPDRTEGDLYLWVSEHRTMLQEHLNIAIPVNEAVVDLAAQCSPKPRRVAARMGARIYDLLTPDQLEAGPQPGHWRRERLESRTDTNQIFPEILVPLSSNPEDWDSLEQAMIIAGHDGAHVHGLHVTPHKPQRNGIDQIKSVFLERCALAGFEGTFHAETGVISRQICHWARWMDLIVLSLYHPTEAGPARRFRSGLRTILHRCPRPVLTVPKKYTQVRRLMLAFDGSPKAWEALYLADRLNADWDLPLHVAQVDEGDSTRSNALDDARRHLAGRVGVDFHRLRGKPEDILLSTALGLSADLILMGGYTAKPLMEMFTGSTVEHMLRRSTFPLLICR